MKRVVTGLFVCTLFCTPASHSRTPSELLDQIRAASLDAGRTVHLESLEIDMGLGQLHIADGWLVPAKSVEGQTDEMIFVGRARFRIEPPNQIAAGQLELFTGERSLDVDIESAVRTWGPCASYSLTSVPPSAAVEINERNTSPAESGATAP